MRLCRLNGTFQDRTWKMKRHIAMRNFRFHDYHWKINCCNFWCQKILWPFRSVTIMAHTKNAIVYTLDTVHAKNSNNQYFNFNSLEWKQMTKFHNKKFKYIASAIANRFDLFLVCQQNKNWLTLKGDKFLFPFQ